MGFKQGVVRPLSNIVVRLSSRLGSEAVSNVRLFKANGRVSQISQRSMARFEVGGMMYVCS